MPKTTQAFATALICPPELTGMKTPHALFTGHGEINLSLTTKHALFCWLVLIVPGGVLQAAVVAVVVVVEVLVVIILSSCDPYEL